MVEQRTTTAPAWGPPRAGGARATATERDSAVNALVLGFAASMWFGWAQQAPPDGWANWLTAGSLVSLVVALAAGVAAVSAVRGRRGASAMADPRARRRYWRVVSAEAVAIGAGAVVLGLCGRADDVAAWILFVVGVHFVPLGDLFHIAGLRVIGVMLAGVGVLAAFAGSSAGVSPSAVAGAGGGVFMVAAGALSLWRVHRGRGRPGAPGRSGRPERV